MRPIRENQLTLKAEQENRKTGEIDKLRFKDLKKIIIDKTLFCGSFRKRDRNTVVRE